MKEMNYYLLLRRLVRRPQHQPPWASSMASVLPRMFLPTASQTQVNDTPRLNGWALRRLESVRRSHGRGDG